LAEVGELHFEINAKEAKLVLEGEHDLVESVFNLIETVPSGQREGKRG